MYQRGLSFEEGHVLRLLLEHLLLYLLEQRGPLLYLLLYLTELGLQLLRPGYLLLLLAREGIRLLLERVLLLGYLLERRAQRLRVLYLLGLLVTPPVPRAT